MFDLHLIPLPSGSSYITHLKNILYIDDCTLPFYTCKNGHCTHWATGICWLSVNGTELLCTRLTWAMATVRISAWFMPSAGPGWKVRRDLGSWFWTSLTLTGLVVGATPEMKVAVELAALTALLMSPVPGSLLLETGETENETSFCQTIPNRDPSIADSSRVQPALPIPGS